MLSSAVLGLKALFKCLVYVLWVLIYIRYTQIEPWMDLRSCKVAKKYPKLWLAVAIVMVLACLLFFVLWMDTKATGVIRYPIMSYILIVIALGTPLVMFVVISIKKLPELIRKLCKLVRKQSKLKRRSSKQAIKQSEKQWTIPELAEIRKKNGEAKMVEVRDVLVAFTIARLWGAVVCDSDPVIDEDKKKSFIRKVLIHLLVKLPERILCDDQPDVFFQEALGEDYSAFEMKFPKKTVTEIDWKNGSFR